MGHTEQTTANYTISSQDQFAKECNRMRLNNQDLQAIVLRRLLLDLLSEAMISYKLYTDAKCVNQIHTVPIGN